MTLGQLLLLYLMAGAAVGVAVYLSANSWSGTRWFTIGTATLFWPLYLPLLLSYREERSGPSVVQAAPPADELAQAIAQVDGELDGAIRSLDGWAEDVLAREKDRLHELRGAWTAQAGRIREMDRLLSRPEATPLAASSGADLFAQRLGRSRQVIEQNRELLRQVRERTYQELLGTLAWVRELVSMIHLAKFTGAPASRAEELVAQIAAAVEGVSALSTADAPFDADTLAATHVGNGRKSNGNGAAALDDLKDGPHLASCGRSPTRVLGR
jgi:hypothetical protein